MNDLIAECCDRVGEVYAMPANHSEDALQMVERLTAEREESDLSGLVQKLVSESVRLLNERDVLLTQLAEAQSRQCPNLHAVIAWLENGCDPMDAAVELRIYQSKYYAAERDTPDLTTLISQASAEERERCAQACDAIAEDRERNHGEAFRLTADECAYAIRALPDTPQAEQAGKEQP